MLAVDQKQKRENQASVALEKLLEVAQSLTGIEGDSKTILQKIAASACAVLGADIAVLYEYDERHDDVRVPPVTWGILRDPEHLETKDASHTSSAIFRILSHEKPIYAHNAGRDWKQSTAETPSGLPSKGFISREGIASSAAVRLMAGRERVGALFINYRTPHTFRARERRNIELFAAQAAVAIRNGRMVAEQSRQHKGHETLNQVGADLASMQDEIAILDRVAKATFETIECQHCTVFRVEGETLVVVASRGNRAWSLPLGLERERKGVAGWVADQGQSALVDDTVVDGRFDPNWSPGQPDPRSLIDVPVHLAGSPYAIISVEHDRIRAFDAHDRQLVETLATQAAQALRNTWLIDGLNQVGQKALRSDQELCQTIVDLVYRLTRCPVAFWRVDPAKSTQAVIIAHEGLRPEYAEDRSLDLETSVVGQVIRTAECANVFDIQEDPRVSKETKTEANLRRWKSLLIVPLLISSGEAMGALSIYSLTRREFAGWEIDLLRAFAGQAGVVMQNTERLRALRQVSTQLSGQSNMGEVYRQIVDGLKGIFPGTSCGIRSYSSETNKFESLIATGLLDGMLDHPPRSNGASAFVIARRTPRYLEGDALAVPIDGGPALRESLLQLGIKASAYLPLVSKMGVVGVLYVDFITPHKFSEDDKRILELFADQAAINIQNARLFEAERERADTIQVLQQISKSISETLDLKAILHQIVDGARKLVHADSGVIHLVDEAKEIISDSYESPQGSGHLSPRFGQRRGLTWKIYEKGQMVEERDILQAAPEVRERDWGGRRALIGLPLKLVDRVSGVLFLYSNNPRVFTSSEKDLLTTLAEQAALAIDNAQRYEQRAKDIAVLEEINAAITTRSWPEIADLIARKAAEISQADYGGLWLVEDSVLVLGAMHPREVPEGAVPPPQQLPMDDASINGWVARTGEPYSVTSGVNEDRHYRRWREDIESSAAVPLRSHGDVIGTLSIESSEPLAFSDYQLELLQCLADQAAIAIENVRSYERQVSLTSDLKRKLDEFEVYTELGQRVANLEVDQIPRLVYEKMNMIMDLSDAQVQFAFYSETKNEVTFPLAIEQDDGRIIDVVRWGKREPGDGMEGESELVEAFQPRHRDPSIRFGLTEYVIGIRAPVLITQDFEKTANALELNEFQVRVLPKFGIAERPTHSWLGVPMIAQGRVIGVISIQSLEQDHAFDQGHVEVLSAVANQAAVAIENARLQAALVAQKQLTTLGTAIAALQHRISNTLSVIVPNVTRLRGRVRTSDKTISEALDIIERNARYMSGILERIQEPLRETEIREVDINAVLNEVAATARDKWLGVPGVFPISLELMLDNSLPLIQAPIGQLTEVFQNLLDNAYRVMANKGGEICISTFHTSAMLCARVCDTGPGIPPKIQQRLFEKPVPSTQPGGGAGLGLWLSRLMLQSIGGNVIIESTKTAEPTGTTMLVQIPVAPAREEVEI